MSRLSRRVAREIEAAGGAAVWAEVMALARLPNIKADLGQGFPEDEVPVAARTAAVRAIDVPKLNQYSPIPGLPRLSTSLVTASCCLSSLAGSDTQCFPSSARQISSPGSTRGATAWTPPLRCFLGLDPYPQPQFLLHIGCCALQRH